MSTIIDGSASVTINSGAVLGITSGTAVASTSGTSIDFTSIPSWVKRVTVMFSAVSTNGTSPMQIQLGAGSVTTSGYTSVSSRLTDSLSVSVYSVSSGFATNLSSASASIVGAVVFSLISSNTWVAAGTFANSTTQVLTLSGQIALGGTLDRLRITTVGGTETFDAGSINILYE